MPQIQFVFTRQEVEIMKQVLVELECANRNEFSIDLTAEQDDLLLQLTAILKGVVL